MLVAAGLTEKGLPFPEAVFGIIALAILVFLLLATLAIGKGRPDRR